MISFILPFYHKVAMFRVTYPLNAAFRQVESEVICVLDEPSDENDILEFVRKHQETRWRVIVNDKDHSWRPPSIAYNIGIRHSHGTHVVLMDAEEVLDIPTPDYLHRLTKEDFRKSRAGIGWHIMDWSLQDTPDTVRLRMLKAYGLSSPSYWGYGFLMCHRYEIQVIRGFDESRTGYGFDDNDIRIRLTKFGVPCEIDPLIRVFHLTHPNSKNRIVEHIPMTPHTVLMEQDKTWGTAYSRVAFDWAQEVNVK